MLRVVVESAKSLPKKKVGTPDPIVSVFFKGMNLILGALNPICLKLMALVFKV